MDTEGGKTSCKLHNTKKWLFWRGTERVSAYALAADVTAQLHHSSDNQASSSLRWQWELKLAKNFLLWDGGKFFAIHVQKKIKSIEKLPVLKVLLSVQNSNQFSTRILLFHELWHMFEVVLTTQTVCEAHLLAYKEHVNSNRDVINCTSKKSILKKKKKRELTSRPHDGAGFCHMANLTRR